MSRVTLVTGATGQAGSQVVKALVDAGERVRALVRTPEGEARLPPGAEAVVGDLADSASLGAAAEGATAVWLLSGYGDVPDALARMRSAGVERVVVLSSSAAPSGDMSNAVARYHIETEQAVEASGLAWTFLRPNSLMSNAYRWVDQFRSGTVRLPFADVPISTIDPADLAAVAVVALTADGHAGRAYRLSGPEALLPGDQVAAMAAATGRDVTFVAQDDAEARREMEASMPQPYVDAFFQFFREGLIDETTVLPTVAEVTGREPGTFATWAGAHADRFR